MQTTERNLVRLACLLHERLVQVHQARYQEVQQQVQRFLSYMESLQRWNRRMRICHSRHWGGAAQHVARQLHACLRDIPFYLGEIEQMTETCNRPCPCAGDVLAEIRQAQAEFEQFEYDTRQQVLSVTTEPIELEHVYLGPFRIQLHIDRLFQVPRRHSPYEIVALDPHPAACNDTVTHPHVRDGELCGGDATAAIAAALAAGRVCDFFLLVRAVLTSYSAHSPFVSLSEWTGTACSDCGYLAGDDETCYCEHCSQDFCGECISYCRRCQDSVCRSCLETCPACGKPVCPNCLAACPTCKSRICAARPETAPCKCEHDKESPASETRGTTASQEA